MQKKSFVPKVKGVLINSFIRVESNFQKVEKVGLSILENRGINVSNVSMFDKANSRGTLSFLDYNDDNQDGIVYNLGIIEVFRGMKNIA